MKKTLMAAVAVIGLFASAAQAADVVPYASVKVGQSWDKLKDKEEDHSNSFKHVGMNLAVGAKIGAARAELEYGVTKMGKKDDGKFGRQALMLNGYYDFENSSILTPYVGAGVGFTDLKMKYSDDEDGLYSKSKRVFAYGLQAGVGIEVAKNVAVDIGYRYLKPSISKWKEADGDSWKNKAASNEAMVGVRFAF